MNINKRTEWNNYLNKRGMDNLHFYISKHRNMYYTESSYIYVEKYACEYTDRVEICSVNTLLKHIKAGKLIRYLVENKTYNWEDFQTYMLISKIAGLK